MRGRMAIVAMGCAGLVLGAGLTLALQTAAEAPTLPSRAETIPGNLRRAYDALRRAGIVPDGEMRVLDSWLEDIQRLGV